MKKAYGTYGTLSSEIMERITGVLKGKEKEKAGIKLKETMDENYSSLGRYIDIQVHDVNRSPQNFNTIFSKTYNNKTV